MAFTGGEDHRISSAEAGKLTANFRGNVPAGTVCGYFFGGETIRRILAQEGCVGIRIYYGRRDDGTSALVLVGVDGQENDLTAGEVAEFGKPCPPFCGKTNALNS